MKGINKKNELNNCNIVKALLMITVVVYHSMVFWKGGWFFHEPATESTLLKNIAIWLNSFHVYAFTLVSGYIFYAMKYENGKYKDMRSFVWNKVKRLMMPLEVVMVVWAIPVYVFVFKPDIITILNKFLLLESPSQLWFLAMLFGVFVLYYLVSDIIDKHVILGCLFCMICFLSSKIHPHFIPNYFQIWMVMKYIPFFFIGVCIRKYNITILYCVPSTVYIFVHVFLCICSIYMENCSGIVMKVLSTGIEFLLCAVGAVGAFFILQRVAERVNTQSKIIKNLSENSMLIFLFHQQWVYIVLFFADGMVPPILLASICFAVSIVGSYLMIWLVKSNQITRFLTSGRFV